MEEKEVTVVITSCNRQDLLEKTFDSLIKTNTYPIKKYIIIEDSNKTNSNDFLVEKYPNLNIQLIYNGENIGQSKSIDKAYSFVDTEYIFHCEDDWEFYKSGYIEYSMKILEEPNILLCWLREDNDTNGHPIEKDIHNVYGFTYRLVSLNYLNVWHGFTWNPTLLKYENYQKIGKYSEIGNGKEHDVSIKVKDLGFRSAKCNFGYVRHIGWDRHIQ